MSYEPVTVAARSCRPTSASSCSSRRPGVTMLPPAQQACARALAGAAIATRRTAPSRNRERGRGMVALGPREGRPRQQPDARHVEVHLADEVLPPPPPSATIVGVDVPCPIAGMNGATSTTRPSDGSSVRRTSDRKLDAVRAPRRADPGSFEPRCQSAPVSLVAVVMGAPEYEQSPVAGAAGFPPHAASTTTQRQAAPPV